MRSLLTGLVRITVSALCALTVLPCAAQSGSADPLNTSPRGLTEMPNIARPRPMSATAPQPTGPAQGALAPVTNGVAVQPALPPDPATALQPVVFGSQMFTGRFGTEPFAGFNPDYQIAIGDRLAIRMWGAFQFDAVLIVDAKGNVFIPNVGPVAVAGVRNGELSRLIENQVKRTFRSSVGVYASLEAAQPVKVYVTGFVRAPGLYGGLSSNSVLYYLDRAGGIDPDRGSFLQIDVLRGGQRHSTVNLYQFLLEGRIEPLQLQDGDTIVVLPRKHAVRVSGEVLNPYVFEFDRPNVGAAELLAMARPRPGATHLSILRNVGAERRSEYHAIADAQKVVIQDGDEVRVTSDKYPGTILVRIEGAHLGERTLVLPYGSQLKDAVARLKPAPQARVEALQLYRHSVALRQKELIEASLRSLETYALTARSATSEEAALRSREAQQILEFIERARTVQPKGQVILAQGSESGELLLEDGDVIRLPERSHLVLVSGEVIFPSALAYDNNASAEDYVTRSGGYTQGADRAKVLVVRQDGSVGDSRNTALQPGDEIMVMPKIETKSVELTRGITQIIYQIAVAAKVLFDL
ncbi:polysaccharide biosynthesis/export family protein [uncultured Piscinibacter sp.]|uniref:polysaccharide biosynthesis/export family protein n=1 Tax=uncultured Piscinibacter sp. TaxID=1131835 RepID=UPI0026381322|nr:polysaccharide biosynthesis/export family protein [uncultured Piscinibacter sp.]